MAFRELVFTVSEDLAEDLGDALMELGALSISVSDAAADTESEKPLYGEPGLTPDRQAWEQSQVIALFDEQGLSATEISSTLTEAGFQVSAPLERSVEEQDWVRLTQSQFEPIQVGQRLWIVPSWHDAPNDPNAVCLAVDPGLAFGTGSHPTTKLCMQWLEEHPDLARKTLLDYGCGSGILAIAAKRLGCGEALGVDIDPQAVISAKDNAKRNEVTVDFRLPEEDSTHSQHDVVVANILANPLQVLAPALCQRIAPNGHIVLSGILERQAEEVIATYQPWIQLHVWRECDGWVCLTGQLTSDQTSQASDTQKKTAKTSENLSKSGNSSKKNQFLTSFGWVSLAALMVVIVLQLLHLGRHAIALQISKAPAGIQEPLFKAFKSIDASLCKQFACQDIPLRDFSAWAIELANLKINPGNNQTATGILELQIRNKLPLVITWPHVMLSITDANDAVISEKLLSPQDWLPEDNAKITPKGSQALQEVSSNVFLSLPQQAAGFRVRLLYVDDRPTETSSQ
ncbi:50S ribosomal protein L11 methyltransferase [Polynucleobacter sp. MWH-CaK5]|uniref:50S ribosomal protein L11 methyltransferase n=1 Tax=Polynucleobacter sp. MWH-CaK5 TaxID=2689107 RepID=UPI001BFEA034|nr:50S ribosomal protein L11 methyltransferase [Polynucleobacter sp. MWH-CaK5]